MSKADPNMERIAELQRMIADFAKIERHVHLADSGRPENDVEHSFGLALTCWFIAHKAAPELDLQKILLYALAHDIVELHAGDTFIFDTERVKGKSAREDAAIDQLYKDWPDFPELAQAAYDYKNKANAEAKFVYAIDKLLPPIMINLGEKEAYWQRHKITIGKHDANRKPKIRTSPEAAHYHEALSEWLQKSGLLYKAPNSSKQG